MPEPEQPHRLTLEQTRLLAAVILKTRRERETTPPAKARGAA